MTNRDMARRLLISIRTVEAHRAKMTKKLRVSNTAQLLKTTIQDLTLRITENLGVDLIR